MPYIIQTRRDELGLMYLVPVMEMAGDLEYLVTIFIIKYMRDKGLNHDTIVTVRGVLTGVLAEFNRRVAFPYEDTKIKENGDVY